MSYNNKKTCFRAELAILLFCALFGAVELLFGTALLLEAVGVDTLVCVQLDCRLPGLLWDRTLCMFSMGALLVGGSFALLRLVYTPTNFKW